ncbi:unnamed protein product [Spirodela intermedia]|uniref:Uncharacterized protein n=1 Tax=Spirodela intermedia TaxID=51605 RepID=A0A7I8IY16_SPIIN|nr:unnamed protein product [Spirodela intermedia]CAA6662053.1 unnamed protein product [Spirodela intermedia]
MAKKGLKTLGVAVAAPMVLTLGALFLHGGGAGAPAGARWRPPVWAFRMGSLSSAFLMGLAAWLVWAEGGFRRQPAAPPLYVAELLLSLAWGPLVLRAGAVRTGMAVCAALLAALLGCSRAFRRCNPIAGDLVKPCLAWACFLAIFNYKLL